MSAANRIQTQTVPTHEATPQRNYPLLSLQAFTTLLTAVAAVMSVVYLVGAIQWLGQTFPGVSTTYTLVVDGAMSFSGTPWSGRQAGMERLDHIIEVNGEVLAADDYGLARQQFREALQLLEPGDTISITFERLADEAGSVAAADGVQCGAVTDGMAQCNVEYQLQSVSGVDFLAFFVLPYITGAIALSVGIALLFLRPNEPNVLLVTIFCVSLGVFSMGLFNNNSTYFALPLWLTATTVGACAMGMIALVIPSRPAFIHRYSFVLMIPPLVGVGVLAYALSLYFNANDPRMAMMVWRLPVGFGVVSLIALMISMILRRRYVMSSIQRDQINTILIGFSVAILPVFLWLLSTLSLLTDWRFVLPFNSATVMPFFISVPVSLAYAVLEYRGFNTDRALSQGATYFLLLVGLVFGYALLVFGVNLLALEFLNPANAAVPPNLADNPFIIGVVIFVIAVAFLPVRARLQYQIDRIYFRERRFFQERLETFTAEVATLRNFTDIIRLYVTHVKDGLYSKAVFVFLPDEETGDFIAHAASEPQTDIRFNADSDLLALIRRETLPIRVRDAEMWQPELIAERSRLNILQAHMILGLRGSRSEINSFVVIAPPEDGSTYAYEEVRFWENISTQMAISVERSKVIESLERRVSELNVLSKVSQAVNFAVEFDDLLELISAQTQNLIEAECFYITLRDPSTNQMYFAFFLEFDERIRNNENRRWTMGNDLFARVLESGKAARHDNYHVAARVLNLGARGVHEDVSAWMAVPLIAGQTYLGVMAAATSRSGFVYTDDQLKIFNDIGSLAATSLDKARLFEETNERARQLRALNDISRQLQAERDIERLIHLITSSAVNILGAEAGSLLLTTEEEPIPPSTQKDLIFRVVVGGSGEDLLGKRVAAGHGLVGEVASKGEPVIVNNTREDDRWEGEVSQEGGFETNAVLAVPLMANNVVIGVLEVLNKKDGSLYVEEDADVLETFAGQAAIALENARLFQETDEQLKRRLSELETLERIDTDLNRALDMERVASITMKWAIANSGASAGLIGLVLQDEKPPVLQVLTMYGYEEEDYPPGGTKRRWMLDRGIAQRVLRTKRADIQPDVAMDPDYVPSLRGSISQITVPMLAGGEIIALLILEKNTQPRLSLLDLAFVQRLADHAAIALENARLYGELANASKLQSKMMGVGAHELKNALTPVRGYVDLVKMMGNISDQQTESLEVIKRNTDRAQLIIQDLRDFAAQRAGELRVNPEPTTMRHIVVETLRPFATQIDEKEQILDNRIINKELPMILGDNNRLIQIMTNFVSNANKYSPSGATITLDAKPMRDMRDANGKNIGDFLQISISDTGIGISEEDQRGMFQPYFRSTNDEAKEKPGTGLGMYLTRELIKQHGGDVWLESELGKGTTFHFTIPLAPEQERTGEPASD